MSTLRTDTLQNAAGTKSVPVDTVVDGSAKAWVNFNGTGTVAIRASFNVSSITDNGAGDYTVNFTTAMPDANFATNVSVRREVAFNNPPCTAIDQYAGTSRPNTTTTTTVMCGDQTGQRDSSLVLVSVFR